MEHYLVLHLNLKRVFLTCVQSANQGPAESAVTTTTTINININMDEYSGSSAAFEEKSVFSTKKCF